MSIFLYVCAMIHAYVTDEISRHNSLHLTASHHQAHADNVSGPPPSVSRLSTPVVLNLAYA
jgi:hypothetical protein